MTPADQIRLLCVLGPIVALLALGFTITLRNGVPRPASGQGVRLLVVNLSKTVAMVGVCIVGLALVQFLLGVPSSMLR